MSQVARTTVPVVANGRNWNLFERRGHVAIVPLPPHSQEARVRTVRCGGPARTALPEPSWMTRTWLRAFPGLETIHPGGLLADGERCRASRGPSQNESRAVAAARSP